MKQLKIYINEKFDKEFENIMSFKKHMIKQILGNDLDEKINQILNKKNNKLKRFVRSQGLLRHQIALEHTEEEYDELLYDAFINRSEVLFETDSDEIIRITIPDDFKQVNNRTNKVIFNGEEMLLRFKNFLEKTFKEISCEIVLVSNDYLIGDIKLNEIKREILFGMDNDTADQYVVISLPHMVNLSLSQIEESLKFTSKSLKMFTNENKTDIDLIHLIKLSDDLTLIEDDEDEFDDEFDENPVQKEQVTGITIICDDIDKETLCEIFEDSEDETVYYINDIFNNDTVEKV